MTLLSANDWKRLETALRKRACITLERELGGYKIRASTVSADKAWNVEMLVRIEQWNGPQFCRKYSESVEEAMRYVGSH